MSEETGGQMLRICMLLVAMMVMGSYSVPTFAEDGVSAFTGDRGPASTKKKKKKAKKSKKSNRKSKSSPGRKNSHSPDQNPPPVNSSDSTLPPPNPAAGN